METSNDQKMTASVVLRVLLSGCLVLAGAGLVIGLYPARTTAQPGPEGPAIKRLNHIDLVVPNVKENRAFFEKYFGFRCIVDRGDQIVVLTDGAGFALALSSPETGAEIDKFQRILRRTLKTKGRPAPTPRSRSSTPLGSTSASCKTVGRRWTRFTNSSSLAASPFEPPKEYHGAWTFFVRAPGGFFVEVFHQSRRGDGR